MINLKFTVSFFYYCITKLFLLKLNLIKNLVVVCDQGSNLVRLFKQLWTGDELEFEKWFADSNDDSPSISNDAADKQDSNYEIEKAADITTVDEEVREIIDEINDVWQDVLEFKGLLKLYYAMHYFSN